MIAQEARDAGKSEQEIKVLLKNLRRGSDLRSEGFRAPGPGQLPFVDQCAHRPAICLNKIKQNNALSFLIINSLL